MDVGNEKIIAYFLNSSSERAEKVLVNGEREEDEHFDNNFDDDEGIDLEDGSFEWNGQNRELKEKGLFVDDDHLNIYYKDSNKKPLGYTPAINFGATDLRILRSEETTRKGIEGAAPDSAGFGETRWKPVVVFVIIFLIAAAALFLLRGKAPGIIPF